MCVCVGMNDDEFAFQYAFKSGNLVRRKWVSISHFSNWQLLLLLEREKRTQQHHLAEIFRYDLKKSTYTYKYIIYIYRLLLRYWQWSMESLYKNKKFILHEL